jgi:hypothetical protein
MSGIVYQRYNPVVIAATSTNVLPEGSPVGLGSFYAITAGTITITRADGTVLLNAFPVAAGAIVPLFMYVGAGATFTTAGGASGTLTVS